MFTHLGEIYNAYHIKVYYVLYFSEDQSIHLMEILIQGFSAYNTSHDGRT